MRTVLASLLVVVMLFTPARAADTAMTPLFKHVPADAGVVLAVPSVSAAVDGFKTYVQAIGIEDDEVAELSAQKVLSEMFEQPDAIDADGPLVVAVDAAQNKGVMVLRLTDVDAWKTSTEATVGESGLLEFSNNWSDWYGKLDGKVLIAGDSSELVKAAAAGDSKLAMTIVKSSEALKVKPQGLVYISLETMRPQINQGMQMGKMMMSMGMMQMQNQGAGAMPPAAMAMFDFMFNELDAFVRDTDAMLLGWQFGADAASIESYCLPVAGSETAKYYQAIKRSTTPLWAGVPAGDAGMYMAFDWQTPPGHTSFLVRMMDKMKAMSASDPNLVAAFESLDCLQHMTGQALAVSIDEGGVVGWGRYRTSQPRQMFESMAKFYDKDTFTAYMQAYSGPVAATDLNVERKQIAGKEAMISSMKFESEDPQAMAALNAIYGGGMTIGFAVDDQGMAFGMGQDGRAEQLLAKVLAGGGATVSDDARVKAAMAALPDNPQAAMLMDLAPWANMGIQMMRQFGAPVQGELAGGKAPLISWVTYIESQGLRNVLHVPSKSLKPVIDFAKKQVPPPGAAPPPAATEPQPATY